MATLQQLYNNIKEFIHQKFENKTEEDAMLPKWVETYFNYNQGELSVNGVTSAEPLVFTFTGTTLPTNSFGSFMGSNMFIDYGDGTIETTTGKFGHTYAEEGTYKIKIYGVITIGNYCFVGHTNLTSIELSNSITTIGDVCFGGCTNLTLIVLNWDTNNKIITYKSNWITNTSSNLKFIIPSGTTSLYTAKGYPSDKLQERA